MKWATEGFVLDSISPLFLKKILSSVYKCPGCLHIYFYVTPSSAGSQKSLSVCSSFYEIDFLDVQTDCKIDDMVPIDKDKMFGKYAGKTCRMLPKFQWQRHWKQMSYI